MLGEMNIRLGNLGYLPVIQKLVGGSSGVKIRELIGEI